MKQSLYIGGTFSCRSVGRYDVLELKHQLEEDGYSTYAISDGVNYVKYFVEVDFQSDAEAVMFKLKYPNIQNNNWSSI
jgi:hypothetical protein